LLPPDPDNVRKAPSVTQGKPFQTGQVDVGVGLGSALCEGVGDGGGGSGEGDGFGFGLGEGVGVGFGTGGTDGSGCGSVLGFGVGHSSTVSPTEDAPRGDGDVEDDGRHRDGFPLWMCSESDSSGRVNVVRGEPASAFTMKSCQFGAATVPPNAGAPCTEYIERRTWRVQFLLRSYSTHFGG
jgi:hypothetical protein